MSAETAMPPGIDEDRVPFEIRRSMTLDYGTFAEDVTPGLSWFADGDHLRFEDGAGHTVARVPLYRLAPVRLKYLAASLESAYAAADAAKASELDQALAAVRAGRVYDRPDRDYLVIPTAESVAGLLASLIVSRAAGVPGWPLSDQCDQQAAYVEVAEWAPHYTPEDSGPGD